MLQVGTGVANGACIFRLLDAFRWWVVGSFAGIGI